MSAESWRCRRTLLVVHSTGPPTPGSKKAHWPDGALLPHRARPAAKLTLLHAIATFFDFNARKSLILRRPPGACSLFSVVSAILLMLPRFVRLGGGAACARRDLAELSGPGRPVFPPARWFAERRSWSRGRPAIIVLNPPLHRAIECRRNSSNFQPRASLAFGTGCHRNRSLQNGSWPVDAPCAKHSAEGFLLHLTPPFRTDYIRPSRPWGRAPSGGPGPSSVFANCRRLLKDWAEPSTRHQAPLGGARCSRLLLAAAPWSDSHWAKGRKKASRPRHQSAMRGRRRPHSVPTRSIATFETARNATTAATWTAHLKCQHSLLRTAPSDRDRRRAAAARCARPLKVGGAL